MCALDGTYYTFSHHGQNPSLPENHDYNCGPQIYHDACFKSQTTYLYKVRHPCGKCVSNCWRI